LADNFPKQDFRFEISREALQSQRGLAAQYGRLLPFAFDQLGTP